MDSAGPRPVKRDAGSATAATWIGVILAVPAALLAVLALVSYLGDEDSEVSGTSQQTEEPASGNSGSDFEPSAADDALDGGARSSGADEDEAVPEEVTGECEVVVSNPLATIHENPDVFSQEVTRVAAGTYPVLDIQVVISPIDEQRWFKLNVNGRSGWLRDSTFDVASKTAACP